MGRERESVGRRGERGRVSWPDWGPVTTRVAEGEARGLWGMGRPVGGGEEGVKVA